MLLPFAMADVFVRPFLPRTAASIASQLGAPAEREWLDGLAWGRLVPGSPIGSPLHLFPR